MVRAVPLAPEGGQEVALGGELLHAVVVGVGHVQIVIGVKGEAGRGI